MKPGPKPRWTKEDLALAYELKTLGYGLKFIAKGLGGHYLTLQSELKRCEQRGVL